MSTDLEKYAQTYGDLGDKDREQLLSHAAALSRERGRPEVMFLDTTSQHFKEQQEHIQEEVRRRKEIQLHVVNFFLSRVPIGARIALDSIVTDFNQEIGGVLPNETQTSYLLLPTVIRRTGQTDTEEALLLDRSRAIPSQLKIRYNHNIRAAVRVGLRRVGDIRNTITLSPEVLSTRNI